MYKVHCDDDGQMSPAAKNRASAVDWRW
jgi:hypothetical protein